MQAASDSKYRIYEQNGCSPTIEAYQTSKTMQDSNAYANTSHGDTVPVDCLPAPEAILAQQLKLKEALTCLDRGDTFSTLRGLYAVADQAGDQWVPPPLCYHQHLHVLMLSYAVRRVMLRSVCKWGTRCPVRLRGQTRQRRQEDTHTYRSLKARRHNKTNLLLPSSIHHFLLIPLLLLHLNLNIKNIPPNTHSHHPQHRLNILLRQQRLLDKNPTISTLRCPLDRDFSHQLADVFAAVLAHEFSCVRRGGDETIDFGGQFVEVDAGVDEDDYGWVG
jgi:hypothetical protein